MSLINVDTKMSKEVEAILRIEGNNECFDCGEGHPTWASINLAIYLCLSCSGKHRSLGVQISRIRSLTLDQWSEKQLKILECGGNNAFRDFLLSRGEALEGCLEDRYSTRSAELYRLRLAALASDQAPPTELQQEDIDRLAAPLPRLPSSKLGKVAAPWSPDCDNCQRCSAPFTISRRRHHCRRCGLCICGTCAPKV